MVDIAITKRLPALRGPQILFDQLFARTTQLSAWLVLALLGAVIVALAMGAALAFRTFGLHFIVSSDWDQNHDMFGALATIYGTLVTSLIAMVIGVPLSFGIALFITEICPPIAKQPLSTAIELLAGIPSIIYGIWGMYELVPILQSDVEPFLVATLGQLPVLGALFQGPVSGRGVLTAGIILAIMILPYISSIMRDVFDTVPPMLKESAYGLGCTRSEVMWHIVLPFTRVGVVGGVMLGLGRAMGETMAVTFVIGNAYQIGPSLLAPGQTISSALANEFAEADGDLYQSSLMALGLVLFVITFIVLASAKTMLMRMQRQAGS